MAWIGASMGQPELQLQWLERAIQAREGALPLLNTDPGMNRLRAFPAFHALIARLGLPAVSIPAPR